MCGNKEQSMNLIINNNSFIITSSISIILVSFITDLVLPLCCMALLSGYHGFGVIVCIIVRLCYKYIYSLTLFEWTITWVNAFLHHPAHKKLLFFLLLLTNNNTCKYDDYIWFQIFLWFFPQIIRKQYLIFE